MPIVGLSPKRADIPRLGKIKKGDEKPEKGPGKDLDYFRITSDRPDLESQLRDLYGEEPRELRVVIPYAQVQAVFDPWMKEYTTTGLKRQCDGVNQVLWLPEGGSEYRGIHRGDAPLPCLSEKKACKCQRNASLKVILPEVFALGRCGYFDVVTSSKHDILHIQASLAYVYSLRGSLSGVPFIIRREAEEKSYPNQKGTRSIKEYNLIKMEVDPQWMQRQLQTQYAEMMGLEPPPAIAPSTTTYASVTASLPAARSAALPEAKQTPQWAIEIKALREILGLSSDDVQKIASDNKISLYEDGVIRQVIGADLQKLANLMRAAGAAQTVDAEIVQAELGQIEDTIAPPLADQFRAAIKAAKDVQSIETTKMQIKMNEATLSKPIADQILVEADRKLKQLGGK